MTSRASSPPSNANGTSPTRRQRRGLTSPSLDPVFVVLDDLEPQRAGYLVGDVDSHVVPNRQEIPAEPVLLDLELPLVTEQRVVQRPPNDP